MSLLDEEGNFGNSIENDVCLVTGLCKPGF